MDRELQKGYKRLRYVAAGESNIDISGAGYSAGWADKGVRGPSGAVQISNLCNKICVVVKGLGANDETASFAIWGYRDGQDAERLYAASATLGIATDAASGGGRWADTLTDNAGSGPEATVVRNSTNHIARAIIPTAGIKWITARITGLDSHTEVLFTEYGVD